jgi:hypothetical protein
MRLKGSSSMFHWIADYGRAPDQDAALFFIYASAASRMPGGG